MRSKAGRLREGRLRAKKADDALNPMDGVANLADAMLVLACGLMLSLIINWNVDIGRTEKLVGLEPGTKMEEMSDMESKNAEEFKTGQGYEEMGVVYRDSTTGKLYVVCKGEE